MSENVCKKCGCVVSDQNSEYCDAYKPKEATSEKKNLLVNDSASRQLSFLNDFLMFIAMILFIAGIIMAMIGSDDLLGYDSNPTLFICGVALFLLGVSTLIVMVFVNSMITITKSAEYYKAQIEELFEIKSKK